MAKASRGLRTREAKRVISLGLKRQLITTTAEQCPGPCQDLISIQDMLHLRHLAHSAQMVFSHAVLTGCFDLHALQHAAATPLQALPMPLGQAAVKMAILQVVVFAVLCVTLVTVDLSMQHAALAFGTPPCKEHVLQMVS